VPLSFTLTYDAAGSQSQVEAGNTSPGPDGWGWTDNYSGPGVSIDPSSDWATVSEATGSQVAFEPSSASACPSSYTPEAPRVIASLSCSTGGGNTYYGLTTNGGLEVDTFTYNSSSQLTEITEADANANTTTILFAQQGSNSMGANYNTACPSSATTCTVATDPASRTLVMEYNSSGQLTGAVDPDGNSSGHTWSFSYDASGNLASITDRNTDVTSFGYDTTNANAVLVHDMTSLTPPNGQSGGPDAGDAWAITYYSSGQVDTQTDPQGLETTFAYSGNNLSPEGGTTTITDPHGNRTVQTYAYGILTSTTTGATTSSAATWTYVRDPNTLMPTAVTDPNGNTTTSIYDSNGNATKITDPVGNATNYTFNSFNEPLTITDPLGIETVNTYDSHGDLTETDVNGLSSLDISTTYVVCQTSCPSGYVAGDVESMTDPNGHTTTYTYDSYGDLASSSLTVGSLTDTTSDSYDPLGARYCEVSPNANAASVSCPAFGASRVADTTTWTYDADGNVTNTTDADANATSYSYDADNNQTQVTDPLTNVTKTAYDADDRTTTVTSGYGTAAATTTTDIYDIAPGSCPSAPSGTAYCTQAENGLSNTTTSYFNALDQMIEQGPPNTTAQSTTAYTYDGVGNVLTQIDASGTTTNVYDTDNRLTGVTYSGTASGYTQPHAVTYAYDADSNRHQMTDGTGTTTYGYDGLERLNSVDNGASNTITYKYDANGNRTCLSYPNSGSTTCLTASSGTGLVSYQYNSANQMTQMTDWLGSGNTTSYTYDNDGNLTKTTYPSGTTTSANESYDYADSLTDTSYKIGSTTTDLAGLTRNADELIGTTTPPVGSPTTYGYDSLNRVTTGTTAVYTYDAASEIASATPTGGSATNFSYNTDGQLCWTATGTGTCTSAPSGATNYTYSSVGERLTSTPSGGNSTTTSWDQAGNLACETAANTSGYSCTSPNSAVTTDYGYNGDGLRTSTATPGILWSSPSTIDSTRILLSVSCASTTFCAAVDSTGHTTEYNGTSWTSPSNSDPSNDLESVSCPTSSFCMAIDDLGNDIKWNGTSWSTRVPFDSTTTPEAVSCSSSAFCMVVDGSGYAWKYTGSWALKKHMDGSNQLESVSCLSTTFCMAIDVSGNAIKFSGGTTWSMPSMIDALGGITSVSCPTASHCVAVDTDGHELTYGGTSWTTPTTIDGTRGIESISCTSTTFCQAVDSVGNAVTLNGSSWTTTDIDGTTALDSVSCQTSTFCKAVDFSGHALTYQPTATTSQFTWDVSGSVPQLLEDHSNYYLYGPNVGSGPVEQISISGSTPTYLISDTTGVREQIGSTGSVVGSMKYDTYGNRCSTCTISTPFGFEGGYTDPTGLVYLVHRYYDPATSQFLSVDPAVGETGTPYAYTSGDPVNRSDPSGACNDVQGKHVYNGSCTGAQLGQIKQAAVQARAAGVATGCSNVFSCIVSDPGSIVASFNANRGTIATGVGITLGVAAAATGVGALAEGSLLLAGGSFGLAAGGALFDGPQCLGHHNTAACAGLVLNGVGALAGGASFGALALGAEGAGALFGAFGINVGLGGLTTDIIGAIAGLEGRSHAC
jgi:RHS repeat-associated protein